MSGPRSLASALWTVGAAALVAGAGALATLALEAVLGMGGADLLHLALLLLPAILVAALCAAIAGRLLAGASIRQRALAVALIGTAVGVASLAALQRLMLLNGGELAEIAVLALYSLSAGGGVSVAISAPSTRAIERLGGTAERLAEGDLDARVGAVHADRELAELAGALDAMAERIQGSLERERTAEVQRRDLVTAVSHDLRTPLASLRAMIEAIDDGVVDDVPTVRRYATEMRGSVNALVTLVDDLFELVQLDAGAIAAESERVAIADAIRSAVGACNGAASEKGLALETHLEGVATARCSPRLARVVQNLLQNAIRHTPSDGTVMVEASRSEAGIEVVVVDSGEGIAPASLERVFEPFWRGDSARSSAGAGLGLALAKRIVESLGGTLDVESAPRQGSRFAVLLPEPRQS